ncbi:MAG: restriction endonuclease [Chitinispirillia bacterium]|nr:restriction endonuclease [Chitinispirillia bacterium]MCL2268155.1 restriction endonuclease [Chitinispirillia bacterium]
MKVVAEYNFNNGKEFIGREYEDELREIYQVINSVDALEFKTKVSKEKTMAGKLLFAPKKLNKAFGTSFKLLGWNNHKVECDYSQGTYLENYKPATTSRGKPFRDMDFIKPPKKLGVEVQFGKYAFMVYNVCAKMTIFKNLGIINAGIEIVPVKRLADEMSTGVSYFEQFAWDLQHRGVSDIDIPVLILGIDV